MSFFTVNTKIKAFSVAILLLIGSLSAINYGFAAASVKNSSADGDSVKALRRIYFSMTKVILPEITTINEKQHVENKDADFLKLDAKNQAGM